MPHLRPPRGFGGSQEPNQDDSDASYTSSTLPVGKVRFTTGRRGKKPQMWVQIQQDGEAEALRGICWLLDISAVSREMTLLHLCSPRNLAGRYNP